MKRFLIFVLLVFLFVSGLYVWRLTRIPPRAQRSTEQFTPASESRIDLDDVQLLAELDREYTRIVEAVIPSVVSITTSRRVNVPRVLDPFEHFFGNRNRSAPRNLVKSALGSGVVVSKEGHVVTNMHVIANYDEIRVQLADGRVAPAAVIGADAGTDIALLKIDVPGVEPLPLGDSDEVKAGQIVFAIGNPFGFQETVTQGIISATGRRVQEDSTNEFFQTDTAINQGNSGGPLVNLRGEIIGINSAIFSGEKAGGWLGVSFAIPSNVVAHAVESLLRTGRVVRGYLGVGIQPVTPELQEEFGLLNQEGALISYVAPGSPAAKAGLEPGDVVKKVNARPVEDIQELKAEIARTEPGTDVTIDFIRNQQEQTVTASIVELGSITSRSPTGPGKPTEPSHTPGSVNPLGGIELVPDSLWNRRGRELTGVMIASVSPKAPSDGILRRGDVIEEINRQQISSTQDFQQAVMALQPGERVLLSIRRGDMRLFVVVEP